MKPATAMFALTFCGAMLHGRDGLPARADADRYPGKATAASTVVAAEVMDPEVVRSEFATSLTPRYYVLEVALYPAKGQPVNVDLLDFGLKVDGRLVRPATSKTIAAMNQKKANARRNDITLWPSVGMTTGSWGTGTNVGVGVGMGGGAPGPGSTDRDRHVMQTELDDRALPEGGFEKPVAGYVYFPAGREQAKQVELVYQFDGGEVTIPLTVPKTK